MLPLHSHLPFKVNLLQDGAVVTLDGEILGTWDVDGSDAIYQFTPDGSSEVLFCEVFVGSLCANIAEWHASQ